MDDLNGLSWSASSNEPKKPPPMSSSTPGLLFPDVRRNDTSGRSTPLSTSSGRSNPPTKPTTPAGDSFANLVSFGSSSANATKNNLSLVEQQKRLQEERAQKDAENKSRFETQYGAQNSHFWDSLEKGSNGPATQPQPQSQSQSQPLSQTQSQFSGSGSNLESSLGFDLGMGAGAGLDYGMGLGAGLDFSFLPTSPSSQTTLPTR